MNELIDALVDCANSELPVSGKSIKQTERNLIKNKILDALGITLNTAIAAKNEELGETVLDCKFVNDGLAINFKHEQLGNFTGVLNITIKNLEYDFKLESENFIRDNEAKEVRKEAALAEKQRKFAETQRLREIRAKRREERLNARK